MISLTKEHGRQYKPSCTKFSMTLPIDFLKQMFIVKSLNSVFPHEIKNIALIFFITSGQVFLGIIEELHKDISSSCPKKKLVLLGFTK